MEFKIDGLSMIRMTTDPPIYPNKITTGNLVYAVNLIKGGIR